MSKVVHEKTNRGMADSREDVQRSFDLIVENPGRVTRIAGFGTWKKISRSQKLGRETGKKLVREAGTFQGASDPIWN